MKQLLVSNFQGAIKVKQAY